MARKTRRRTQKRSRRSRRRGKSARKKRRSRQRGGSKCSASESQPAAVELAPAVGEEEPVAPAQDGGRRRKTAKKGKKGKKGKRKLNEFFKVMLKAKKAGAASFKYKGKTYKGRKHHRLGMVYKKA